MPLFELPYRDDITDQEIDSVFREEFRNDMSYHHWTPLAMVKTAADWLAQYSNRICDMGCGPGKFCLVGASMTDAHYTGIDYRTSFIDEAKSIAQRYLIDDKTTFVCNDIVNENFDEFDGFYFYNPYLEHLYGEAITPEVVADKSNVKRYTDFVHSVFDKIDRDVSIVTYENLFSVVPMDKFELKKTAHNDTLCLYQNF